MSKMRLLAGNAGTAVAPAPSAARTTSRSAASTVPLPFTSPEEDGLSPLALSSDFLADLRPILFMAIALMLGFSALIRAYSEKMGFSEQALQYQRMRGLFTRAARGLNDSLARGDDSAVQRVLLELGEEALQENADWVLFRRSHEIEIPNA